MSPSPPDPMTPYIAIVRKDYQTTTFQISANQFVFLNAVCAGGSIERALAVVGAHASVTTDQAKATWARMDDVCMAWIDAGFLLLEIGNLSSVVWKSEDCAVFTKCIGSCA